MEGIEERIKNSEDIMDRAMGSMYGAILGDAIGF